MDPREPQAPPQAAESVVSEVYAGAEGNLQLGGFGDSQLLHIPNHPRKERDQESAQYAAGANLFVPVAENPEKTLNSGRDSVFERPESEVVVSTLPRPGHHGQETGTVVSSLRPNQARPRPAPVPLQLAIPERSAPVSYSIPVVHPVRQPQLQFHRARPPPPPIVEAVTHPSPHHVFGSFEEVEASYEPSPTRHGFTSREVDYAPAAEALPSPPPPPPPRPTPLRPQNTNQWGSLHSSEDTRAAVEPPIAFTSVQSQSPASQETSSQEAFPWQDEYDYEYEYEEEYEDDDDGSGPQALQAPISVQPTHLNPNTLFGFTVPAPPQKQPDAPPSPPPPHSPPSRPPRPPKPFVGSGGLPERAGSGLPRTHPPKKKRRPKKTSPSRASKLSPTPKAYYDPFSFQQSGEGKVRKGRQHASAAATAVDGFPDDLSVSQQRRVPSVTVGRQISNSFGGGGGVGRFSNVIDDAGERLDRNGNPIKRNMLMNIILRPGGGNKKKALPRPKVDVKAEGANVIIIKMTFPDNENIQGLRAFTPTDPRELDQFADLDDLVPVGSSISKVTAQAPRNKFFFDAQSGQIRDRFI